MPSQPLECGRIDLASLLTEDRVCGADISTLEHLEECSDCQRRLETLAASDEWWHACQTHLGSEDSKWSDLGADFNLHVAAHDENASLRDDDAGMLLPPSHPEMLGRIGRYEVEGLLGRGGMGVVFKAFDSELHRPVAIKVLAPHLAGSGAARQRFGRETRAAAAVAHEHVVAIHDVEVTAKNPYLVMQYVPGESLQAYVDRHGPLELSDLVRIGHQIAAGLASAHAQGLIHRDIKPSNIMLENGLGRVVITDFGLARAADDASLTQSGIVAGTPHYMSPEQARGEPADARCDLFSLGAVLYFMTTGHPPFRAEQAMAVLHRICHDRPRPLYQINPNIPDDLAGVIDRLLEKKPSRRFASATVVQHALAGVLNGMQQPRRWRVRRWLRRMSSMRWQVSIATLALIVVSLAWVWIYGWPWSTQPTEGPVAEPRLGQTATSAPLAETDPSVTASQLREFTIELNAFERSLRNIEDRPFPETTSLRSTFDPWIEQLNLIVDSVTTLERSWPVGSESPISKIP